NPRGDWIDGTFKGAQSNGWVQLLARDADDLQVDHGFSGAGVWDDTLRSFAGILTATRPRHKKPVALMIPTCRLQRAWPGLPVLAEPATSTSPTVRWPRPPLIVHRYTLLDNQKGLIGRKHALATLKTWQNTPGGATVLTLHAIGGSGKSALAWTWFN